jgi:phosphatidylserine/phosphatidylglycerophosphate/cardiolipin synthase-like enzyme
VAEPFEGTLAANPELRLVVVIPLVPDIAGLNRVPQVLGRERALDRLMRIAPGRVAAYGLENHAGTPVYVHAKVCVIDDTWASTGSDNFNRRSWTHDSELTAVVLDQDYARDLRLTLAAEHLDRLGDVAERGLAAVMSDCVDPAGMYDAYAEAADRLEAWHRGGREGDRPAGRLRPIPLPPLTRLTRAWAKVPLNLVHDPDGRPRTLRSENRY